MMLHPTQNTFRSDATSENRHPLSFRCSRANVRAHATVAELAVAAAIVSATVKYACK